MWQPSAGQLATRLSEHFGLQLIGTGGRDKDGHPSIQIQPTDLPRHKGFRIVIQLGWRSLRAQFLPGAFAGDLVGEMGKAPPVSKSLFAGLAQRSIEEGAMIVANVNGGIVTAIDPRAWPSTWQRFDVVLEKTPLAVNTEDNDENDCQLERWARRFTAMVLALVPLERINEQVETNPEGLPEGACVRVQVNRYERNRVNRASCIEILGDSCKACGFNFGRAYGSLGLGFIHIHHVVPLSELGHNYVVDPSRDLVPLCPNCHAMVHQRKPPLSIDELVRILACAAG